MNSGGKNGRAVVLGASMAGLLSARVLADFFESVIVVDRDDLDGPVGAEPRRGVPQGRHAHGLLAAGLSVIEELLPGATADLVAGGAPTGDTLANIRFCTNGYRLKQAPLGQTGLAASRPYLESYIRNRVAALANVTLLGGRDVVGIEATADRDRITGAWVQERTPGSDWSPPIWCWTRPAAVRERRSGSANSAFRCRPRRSWRSTSATPRGTTG